MNKGFKVGLIVSLVAVIGAAGLVLAVNKTRASARQKAISQAGQDLKSGKDKNAVLAELKRELIKNKSVKLSLDFSRSKADLYIEFPDNYAPECASAIAVWNDPNSNIYEIIGAFQSIIDNGCNPYV